MKRILLATDGSNFSLSAAAYLADLYKGSSDLDFTVLNILPAAPSLYREEQHDPLIRKDYAEWKKKKTEEGQRYTEEAIKVLRNGDFEESQLQVKHPEQIVGVARDILREAAAGSHDACVIGKKGMGWIDDVLLGSITSKLLEISENHPVWLVSGNEWKSRKVLLAMDHTPSAVQLARYVGEMLRGLEAVQITLYHYCPPFDEYFAQEEEGKMTKIERRMVERDEKEINSLFDEALNAFEDLGYNEKALTTRFEYGKSSSTRKISPAIIKELLEGDYGTLVLGRKGFTQATEFRLGSVVLRTIRKVDNRAVWIVPV
jgi:nucleotide-binding universal stress UspA family protein